MTVTWLSRTLVLSTTSTSISSSLAKRYLLTPTIVSKRKKLILFTDRGELDRRRKLPISDMPDIGENRNRCTGHSVAIFADCRAQRIKLPSVSLALEKSVRMAGNRLNWTRVIKTGTCRRKLRVLQASKGHKYRETCNQ